MELTRRLELESMVCTGAETGVDHFCLGGGGGVLGAGGLPTHLCHDGFCCRIGVSQCTLFLCRFFASIWLSWAVGMRLVGPRLLGVMQIVLLDSSRLHEPAGSPKVVLISLVLMLILMCLYNYCYIIVNVVLSTMIVQVIRCLLS